MRIVCLDIESLGPVKNLYLLEQHGTVRYFDNTEPDERLEHIGDADIIVTNKVRIDRAIMDACPSLKLICVAATGTNTIDLVAAGEKGIGVKNVAGYSTESVTQITFAILLSLMCHIEYFDRYVRSGGYAASRSFTHYGRTFQELSGKQFGIIGLGAIGRRVAEVASAFGASPVYYSTSGKNLNGPYPRLELDDLLRTSDVVSIHAPLNEHTRDLLNYSRIALMKPTAYLLNVGRGHIINEEDLARALDEELIAGAGLDVHSREPIKADNPLLTIRNRERLIQTPHIAWISDEARTLLVEKVAENISTFLRNLASAD
jgi:glycerate dehydrogenase